MTSLKDNWNSVPGETDKGVAALSPPRMPPVGLREQHAGSGIVCACVCVSFRLAVIPQKAGRMQCFKSTQKYSLNQYRNTVLSRSFPSLKSVKTKRIFYP